MRTVTIRNLPDNTYRALKVRAAPHGRRKVSVEVPR
jgi:plasmid stability protein